MCGPSTSERNIEASQQTFMQELQGNYATNLAEQQSVLAHINDILQPVLAAGPSQTGFSPSEKAALDTQALDTTGANYANAAREVGNETAGRNDSGNLPESGVDRALKAQVASKAAGQTASEELGITEADYATGRQNFNNAVAGEEGLASAYSPIPYAGAANTANEAAFSEADKINQESNQVGADIGGGIESLAGAGLKFAGGFMGGGGFEGGIDALAGV